MRRGCLCSLFVASLVLALQGCAGFYFHKAAFSPPPPPPRSSTLSEIPIREYWTGVVFNGFKVGFSHFRLVSTAEEVNRFGSQAEAYSRTPFFMLEFGRIKCDTVIGDPDRLHWLTVHVTGVSESVAIRNNDRQTCTRSGNGSTYGIVYAPEFRGFLYHSWTESIVDGRWIAVDPTLGQIPFDAPYIKPLEGQNLSDLTPLVDTIGKPTVRILSDA